MRFIRFVMLLALVVWVGGIIFFAFVVAPAVFGVLPVGRFPGNIIARCIEALHWMGVGCGLVFLSACSFHRAEPRKVGRLAVAIMVVLTLISQVFVVQRMEKLRTSTNAIEVLPPGDVRGMEFNRLHHWSTTLESVVLLLGLVAIYDVARMGTTSAKAQTEVRATSPG